ncbi:MAG: AMP-binding protein [Pseudomonadales bacterium]
MANKLLSIVNNAKPFTADHLVCKTSQGCKTWQQLQQNVAEWQRLVSACPDDHIVVYHDEGFHFLSILLAAWRQGKAAVVPANTLPGTLDALSQSYSRFVGQFPDAYLSKKNAAQISDSASDSFSVGADDLALVIFTSGSSGKPTPIAKYFRQLDNELRTLESKWGETLQDASVSGTVSHHHMYGLLFRLLWPAASGRLFVSEARDYLEELAADAADLPSRRLAAVASPAHLSRLPELDWPALQDNLALLFSSGAALDAESAQKVHGLWGREVTEIYGSSETGAIAWRHQASNAYWAPLPGIKVRLDDKSLLNVDSPHLPDKDSYQTQDMGELNRDGRFKLLGRADRIAKVGGKRVSLTQIERSLVQDEWVDVVKVCIHPDKPDRLCAVVQLLPAGAEQLADKGKNAINQRLRQSLHGQVEQIAVPRYWRYVPSLPADRQGKVTQESLTALFQKKQQVQKEQQAVMLPKVERDTRVDANERQLELTIQPELFYFQGHFPMQPILPGIVQVHWATHYGREAFPCCKTFARMEAVKFQQVIRPGQRLTLNIKHNSKNNKLTFAYFHNDLRFSSGRLCFQQEADNV